jgi:hypothetical protein
MRSGAALLALFLAAAAQDDPPDKAIRVLYVDHLPRFEYRFLQRALVADGQLRVHVFLCSADADWEQPASRGATPLRRSDLEALLADPDKLGEYRVVIWGDLSPAHSSSHAPTQRKILEALRAYVEGGGGLLFHAGAGYLQEGNPGRELAALAPYRLREPEPPRVDKEVEALVAQLGSEAYAERESASTKLFQLGDRAVAALRRAVESADPEIRDRATALLRSIQRAPGVAAPAAARLTEAGRSHAATRLEDSKVWAQPPRIRWAVRPAVAAEGAEVLAELETGDPLLLVRALGKGRVAALLTDEWWLWRQEGGYYPTYRALIDWLAAR